MKWTVEVLGLSYNGEWEEWQFHGSYDSPDEARQNVDALVESGDYTIREVRVVTSHG